MKKRLLNINKKSNSPLIIPIITIITIGIITVIATNLSSNWTYDWSGIRKEIRDSLLITQKRAINEFGVSMTKKDEIQRRKWIMNNSSINELLKLTKYPDIKIKMIAYEGLIRKKEFDRKKELTILAIQDTSDVLFIYSSCLILDSNLGEYLIQNVLLLDENIPYFLKKKVDFGFTKLEKQEILKVYSEVNSK